MWNSFKELKNAASRAKADTVGDVMHACETVPLNANLDDATSILLRKKVHRLAVVDDDGKLYGILSRGDIMRATLDAMKGYCTFDAGAASSAGAN